MARGMHWKDKVEDGTFPKVHEHAVKWTKHAEKLKSMLTNQLRESRLCFVLPWHRRGCVDLRGGSLSLYAQLLIHHLNKVVELEFSNTDGIFGGDDAISFDNGFFGIKRIKILDHVAFNENEFGIHTVAWAKGREDIQVKTITKHWASVGMKEHPSVEEGVHLIYAFEKKLRTRHEQVNKNAQKRKADRNHEQQLKAKKGCVASAMTGEESEETTLSAAVTPEHTANAVLQVLKKAVPQPATIEPYVPPSSTATQACERAPTGLELLAHVAAKQVQANAYRTKAAKMEAKAEQLRSDANRLDYEATALQACASEMGM